MSLQTPDVFEEIINHHWNQPRVNQTPNGKEVSWWSDPQMELVTNLFITIDTKEIISHQGAAKQNRS